MGRKPLSKNKFIQYAINKHGNNYDYSLVDYVNSSTKVKIICLRCDNIFEQRPNAHLRGQKCPICNHRRKIKTNEEFIKQSKQLHNNKYDYSLVKYQKSNIKVKIKCLFHGIFLMKPNNHLGGQGCPICGLNSSTNSRKQHINEFIQNAHKLHNNKYDYSLVDYINNHTKVKIICPIHGIFKQSPKAHNMRKQECPKCSCSSQGEMKIIKYLDNLNINYIFQHKFSDCLSPKGYELIFDFYLPEHSICIEYDGEFHFKQFTHNKPDALETIIIHDKTKNEYCKNNKIKMCRIPYTKYDIIEEILDGLLNLDINLGEKKNEK